MIPRYSTPELDAIWSPQAKFELWLEIETLLIEVFEQRNEAPSGTAALIREKVTINADRILEAHNPDCFESGRVGITYCKRKISFAFHCQRTTIGK